MATAAAWRFVARNPTLVAGLLCLALLAVSAIGAPRWTGRDPQQMSATARLRPPSGERLFGTDHYGRDIYARTLHGGRISLRVGVTVAVITALVVPEIPRVVRVVRASVLSLRDQTMVEGARAVGAGAPRILLRYVLPALVAPLIVQGTHIAASAILVESYLSFLGAGTPPHIPS